MVCLWVLSPALSLYQIQGWGRGATWGSLGSSIVLAAEYLSHIVIGTPQGSVAICHTHSHLAPPRGQSDGCHVLLHRITSSAASMKPAFLVYYLVFCVLDERRVPEPEPKSDPSKGRIAGRTGLEPSQERVRSVNEWVRVGWGVVR